LDEWQLASRNKVSLALIPCDVDHFKAYNDSFGHTAGDECLRQVAGAISHAAQRRNDMVARYGGEEFAVLMSNVSHDDVMNIAMAIQENIKTMRVPASTCQEGVQKEAAKYITIGMGICLADPEYNIPAEFLIANADMALYEAKSSGRNCIKEKDFKSFDAPIKTHSN